MIGDGYCNDETNNADCNYDGGDCCKSNVYSQHCTECICYFQENCLAGVHPLVGNGDCNDETNNEDCNYDGGDCCLTNNDGYYYSFLNKDHCSECLCLGGGIITSPGFPGTYGNNLDTSWLIKHIPSGYWIEINFISFDIGDDSSCK